MHGKKVYFFFELPAAGQKKVCVCFRICGRPATGDSATQHGSVRCAVDRVSPKDDWSTAASATPVPARTTHTSISPTYRSELCPWYRVMQGPCLSAVSRSLSAKAPETPLPPRASQKNTNTEEKTFLAAPPAGQKTRLLSRSSSWPTTLSSVHLTLLSCAISLAQQALCV